MKHIILASASVLAMIAAPASAQDAPVNQGTPADNAPQGAATPPTSAPQAGLQDIIVTANRTSQISQKAPLALNVIKPEELIRQNVTRSEDLSRLVPALVATSSGGANTTFFLRGVGNTTVNSYSDPAISFNYDGVYIGRPNSTQGFFYDLQRIEVLKGPQGTLYGRNATGGAINVIPNRPRFGETSAEGQVSVGNYDAVQAQGAINLPLGSSGDAAIRVSGMLANHDGYYSDGTGDQKQYSLRAQIMGEFAPGLTTRFAVDYGHQGGAGAGSYIYGTFAPPPTGTTGPYTFTPTPQLGPKVGAQDPRTDAFVQTRFINQAGRTSEVSGGYPSSDNSVFGVHNETILKTATGALTVQAAYRSSSIDSLSTTSNFRAFKQVEKNNQITLEARYAGKIGTIADYLVGAFYFDEKIDAKAAINQITVLPIQNYKTGTKSKAVFGRIGLHVTDTITVSAAGRYTDDKKFMNGFSNVFTFNCGNPNAPPQDLCPGVPLMPLVYTAADLIAFYTSRGIPVGNNGVQPPPILNRPRILNTQIRINTVLKTEKFTYRLGADWQLTPSNLLYVAYETGFHGGGFNFGKGRETYQPESIRAISVGSKNRFFGNRLQLNLEAFYWKYKDQQIAQFGTDFSVPPISVFYTSNIGKSTIKGFDIDLDYLVTPTTRIGGSVQYLDTKYNSYFVSASARGPRPNFNNCAITGGVIVNPANPALDIPYSIDCSGNPALYAPKWSFNANIEQTFKFDNFKLVAQAGTRWRGDFFAATSYQPWVISKAAFQSDASLTLAPNSDGWFVSAFVNNIENKRRITQSNVNATLGTQSALATAPRTYGVRVGAKFR